MAGREVWRMRIASCVPVCSALTALSEGFDNKEEVGVGFAGESSYAMRYPTRGRESC